MAYQVYFADLTEENKSLVLSLLRLKEESGKLEPDEEQLLATLREAAALLPQSEYEVPPPPPMRQGGGRRFASRRSSGNGRGHTPSE